MSDATKGSTLSEGLANDHILFKAFLYVPQYLWHAPPTEFPNLKWNNGVTVFINPIHFDD